MKPKDCWINAFISRLSIKQHFKIGMLNDSLSNPVHRRLFALPEKVRRGIRCGLQRQSLTWTV